MRKVFLINFMNAFIINFFLVNVDFVRDIVLNTDFQLRQRNFKESIDEGNVFGALVTDFSKAFDCIYHTLLIAKHFVFRVSPLPLKFMYSYLPNRNQRTKINKKFSDRTDIEFGVPQDSVLGPLQD